MPINSCCQPMPCPPLTEAGPPGPQGLQGPPGPKGEDGVSAFTKTSSTVNFVQPYLDQQIECTLTSGSATIVTSSTSTLRVGMKVIGTGIPTGTTITSITNATTFEVSGNATSSGSSTLSFRDSVLVTFENTSWMAVGMVVFVQGGGHYEVDAIPSTTTAVLHPIYISGFAASGTLVGLGLSVVPSGVRGPQGLSGAMAPRPVVFVTTTSYTVTTHNSVLLVDTSVDDVTITLPPASVAGSGFVVTIKKIINGNDILISSNGSPESTNFDLTMNYPAITLLCDGTNWWIISTYNH